MFEQSKLLSVFVGLIITNCIVLGRAEAFALANGPWRSILDGLGNGLGYGLILIIVGKITANNYAIRMLTYYKMYIVNPNNAGI